MSNPNLNQIADHLFRHSSGKMVSVLTKIFGTENLETAEDVVQQTFIDAIRVWKIKGIPDNPNAWLFRVAKNKAIDIIRRNKHSVQYDFSNDERMLLLSEYTMATTMNQFWNEELIKDDLLRMMFACCHPDISEENQMTLILKTLCGFSTSEIAKAFLTTDDTISKRLYRTKEFFREHRVKLIIPSVDELKKRVEGVLHSIYLLFNEGYNSTNAEDVIREDLIDEAMMLCRLLTENKHTQMPETFALMALMCFHSSRTRGRIGEQGEIILLPNQDRSRWDKRLMEEGNSYLNKAAFGTTVSSFHLEAAIAYEHCIAKSFDETNWEKILQLYEWLCIISPSPVSELNKVVAVLQVKGPAEAMKALHSISGKKRLESYYLYHSLLGEIHLRMKLTAEASCHFKKAISLTKSEAEKKVLRDKLAISVN